MTKSQTFEDTGMLKRNKIIIRWLNIIFITMTFISVTSFLIANFFIDVSEKDDKVELYKFWVTF